MMLSRVCLVVSMVIVWWMSACLATTPDGADPDEPPAARLVPAWDPLACGAPHRVVLELEDEDGAMYSSSVPCALGSMTLDLRQWGTYYGRFYGWELGEPIRKAAHVSIAVDAPVVRWQLAEPP